MGGVLTHYGLSRDPKPADRKLKFLQTSQPSSQPTAEPPVDAGSPETIRLIFSQLDATSRGRMAQLSSAWKAIAEESWLWTGNEARVRLPENNGPALDCIRRRGIRKLKVLSISGHPEKQLLGLLQALPDMQSLDLSSCKFVLDDYTVKTSLETLQHTSLTSLNLQSCYRLSDYSVYYVTEHLPNLEELYLGYCKLISNFALSNVSARLRKLKVLEISGCAISDYGLWMLGCVIVAEVPLTAARGVKELESLTLASCKNVTDIGLSYISESMVHLVTLDVSNCPNLSDAGVESVSKIVTLKRLVLKWCPMLTQQSIRHLASRPSSLELLDIRACSLIGDQAVSYIDSGPGLLELTTLHLRANPITDNGVAKLARTLSHLTKFDVTMCKLMTNEAVGLLADHLPELRWLRMQHCTRLTNGMVRHLTRMHCVEVLSIRGCAKITGVGWKYAARSGVRLNVIELDVDFTGAGDCAVRFIAQCMPKLRSLSLGGCRIGDGALSFIDRHMPRLHTLRLLRCFHLTDGGLDALGRHHKDLKVIVLTGCVLVTRTAKQNLAARLPYLTIR